MLAGVLGDEFAIGVYVVRYTVGGGAGVVGSEVPGSGLSASFLDALVATVEDVRRNLPARGNGVRVSGGRPGDCADWASGPLCAKHLAGGVVLVVGGASLDGGVWTGA